MYSIFADAVCIYSDTSCVDSTKVINPKLTLEDNGAGSLIMTLPPCNVGYNTVQRLVTDISVRKDGVELWAGRVLSEERDFWNNRVLYCEGELAFFNDTTQPPNEYPNIDIQKYIAMLVEIHNSKAPQNRRFAVGAVTVHDINLSTYRTNYEKTIESLNNLVQLYGGHLRVRKSENGTRYLDYLRNYPDTCSQTIEFGKNLIDFTRKWDSSEFATVIVPLGKRLDDSPVESLDAYLTVESVNSGSLYVQSSNAVNTYGWIEKTVTWDDVEDPAVLLEKAKEYLADLQFDNMEIELSALDMHYLNVDTEAVKLLDEIQVISRPHGLNRLFPVTKLEIPLDSPEKTQFKLGDTVKTSLSGVNNQINAAIIQKIDNLPKAHSILKEAKENATQIMNMATTGYITITQDEHGSETLYISNIRDYTKADKLWKWNMNGLGYSSDGGKNFGLAITMDGAIVADFITTGVLSADRIRAGILADVGGNFSLNLEDGTLVMKKGSITIGADGKGRSIFSVDTKGNLSIGRDEYGRSVFAVDTEGNVTMKKGSITIGSYKDENGQDAGPVFSVDKDGNLFARNGTFAGNLLGAKGTFGGELVAVTGDFKGVVQASDFLDRNGNSMMSGKKFASDYLDLYGLTIRNKTSNAITFQVDQNGKVTISGSVTIAKGSISIGTDSNNPKFLVTNNGDVTMAGSINLAGNITWSTDNSPCHVLYARSALGVPSGMYNTFSDYNDYWWHKVFGTYDYYASYTYDGGRSWTSAIKVRGTDGQNGLNGSNGRDGVDGVNGSDATVTRYNIWRAMLSAAPSDGLYSAYDSYTGQQALLIRASAIQAGVIDAGKVYLEDGYGGFCSGIGRSDYGETHGAKMYGKYGTHYVIATESGVRMQAPGTSFYVVSGSVTSTVAISQPSDSRLKNSITYDLERYKEFFQALKPCGYKFNNGTSGRNHIGYIAQDVEAALNESGISSTDFAGFIRTQPEEGFHVKLEDEYQLRYSEFIALNTYMIQSAWNEIDRLKVEVQKLRERCEIQNEENP